jgi:hypothetical protein
METFIFIVLVHWVADFIFQDEYWAINKSKEWSPLLKHTLTYSLLWIIPIFIFTGSIIGAFIFSIVTFIAHTITDYFTSRVVSKKFKDGHYGSPIPNFGAFTIIGFDQVLHYVQLILTWYVLFNF